MILTKLSVFRGSFKIFWGELSSPSSPSICASACNRTVINLTCILWYPNRRRKTRVFGYERHRRSCGFALRGLFKYVFFFFFIIVTATGVMAHLFDKSRRYDFGRRRHTTGRNQNTHAIASLRDSIRVGVDATCNTFRRNWNQTSEIQNSPR